MKRSQMLQTLHDTWVQHMNCISEEGDACCKSDMDVMDKMLKAVEEAGMYPPDRYMREADGYVQEWEPE